MTELTAMNTEPMKTSSLANKLRAFIELTKLRITVMVLFTFCVAGVLAAGPGVPIGTLAWAAPISAGLAFMLPTSTPALAMVFGTGYLRIKHTLPGVLITIFSLSVFLIMARWLWPLVGLPVTS